MNTMDIGLAPERCGNCRIAVLVPTHNEEQTICQVVGVIRDVLPQATVYVYDNNSTDRTVEFAQRAGAVIRRETRQGKGYVVRRMFADIEADIYILIDGDGTYHIPSAPAMVAQLVEQQLDVVVGTRVDEQGSTYRLGHVLGNRLLTGFIAAIFGGALTDALSGYRVLSRRFVKSFPALSSRFEIETELTVHALELGLPVAEVATPYSARPEGSTSNLNTWRDGLRVLWTIIRLYQSERPFLFFSTIGAALASAAIVLAIPLFVSYFNEGIILKIPTAILVTGMMVLSFLLSTCGLILDTVTRGRQEIKRLTYLAQGCAQQGGMHD